MLSHGSPRRSRWYARRRLREGLNCGSLLRVPYRPTERTEARRAAARERIVRAAHALIARGGYREAQVAAVAAGAGVATGSVYSHFPSKADLFAEVFRRASQREVDARAPPPRRPAARRRSGWPPRSRPSRGGRCAAGDWPGRCWPSPSTPPSRPSAWPSAAPMPPASPRSCARASRPASCRRRTSSSPPPHWSARWARRSSARCPRRWRTTSTPSARRRPRHLLPALRHRGDPLMLTDADHDPRGPQPGPAAGGPQPVRRPRGAAGGARARGRRLGARAPARRRRVLGRRAHALGRRGQRAPAGPPHPSTASATASTRSSSTPRGTR